MKKTFDCVQMKNEIQQRLLERMEANTEQEARAQLLAETLEKPELRQFVERLEKLQPAH